jgi:DNA-directed RNA polymerase specialized sigma24 family protein
VGRRKLHEQRVERDSSWEPTPELQDKVYLLAGRWSRDRREVRQDLYQEGMLAIWAKGETGAPLIHQLRTAQNRMLSVRKLGKSVDGKLDSTYKRPRPYAVLSMETQGIGRGDDLLPFRDILPDPCRVEQHVVAKLTVLEILAVLEPEERHCVLLLCQGFTMREVTASQGCPPARVRRYLAAAREKLRPLVREGINDENS